MTVQNFSKSVGFIRLHEKIYIVNDLPNASYVCKRKLPTKATSAVPLHTLSTEHNT